MSSDDQSSNVCLCRRKFVVVETVAFDPLREMYGHLSWRRIDIHVYAVCTLCASVVVPPNMTGCSQFSIVCSSRGAYSQED